jgi:hypothetical protein
VRQDRTTRDGALGEKQVDLEFSELGWLTVRTPIESDLGTDIFVEMLDERLFDLGLILSVQVKSGKSYFRHPVKDADGNVTGWSHREDDYEHVDQWVRHELPHIIVLRCLERKVSYWAHVTADSVKRVGVGTRIFVPKDQTIDDSQRDSIIDLAASQRRSVSYEGSAWGGLPPSAPSSSLRYALIAPRSLGPHPNQSYSTPLEPEQALGLIVLGRQRELEDRLGTGHAGPSLAKLHWHRDWRWRLVGAYFFAVSVGNELTEVAASSAPNHPFSVAAAILRSCSLASRFQLESAIELLTAHVDRADAADLAWLLVQRARFKAELGEIVAAQEDAAAAQRALRTEVNDITANALNGAAAGLLYSTSGGGTDIEKLVSSSDTVASWWRAQVAVSGYAAQVDSFFKDWVQDRSVTIGGGDKALNRFGAAVRLADHVGDVSGWRSSSRALGRYLTVTGVEALDEARIARGLRTLVGAGDDKSVEMVSSRLWKSGPLRPLVDVVRSLDEAAWTRTTGLANLKLVTAAADLLSEDGAVEVLKLLLRLLSVPTDAVNLRMRATFSRPHFVGRAVSEVLSAWRTAGVHALVVRELSGMVEADGDLDLGPFHRVVASLSGDKLGEQERLALQRLGEAAPDPMFAAAALGAIEGPDTQVKLVERAVEGDRYALAQLPDVRVLTDEQAAAVIGQHVERVRENLAAAQRFTYTDGDAAVGKSLVVLNCHFPRQAQWDELLEYLESEIVFADQKRGPLLTLASLADRLPAEVKARLTDYLQGRSVYGLENPFGTDEPLGGAPNQLRFALKTESAEEFQRRILQLMVGDWNARRDGAHLLAYLPQEFAWGVYASLCGDQRPEVRAAAATSLVTKLSWDRHSSGLAEAFIGALSRNDGTLIALQLAGACEYFGPALEEGARELICGLLADHASSIVRRSIDAVQSQVGPA